jgi:deoxyxylulose-5-phosphate synthase
MDLKISKEELIKFERKIADKYDNGEIPYLTHLSGGNENQLIKIFKEINEGDYIFSTHRSHYHYLLAGGTEKDLEKKILDGKSMFIFDRKLNFFSSSIVAATPSIAAGVALAIKRVGSKKKVWCFIGDGAADEGHFYEAVRYVEGWNLPCTFIVEDNNRSVCTTKKERWNNWNDFLYNAKCIMTYKYYPTYPHSGSGSNKWIAFKKEAKIVKHPKKISSNLVLEHSNNSNNCGIPHLCDIRDIKPMTYFEAIKSSMEKLAENYQTVFIGYNVKHGLAYGSLKNIDEDKKIETPLAENLMAGLAMGMSLEGYRPVLFFERHDFILNAIDAIVNTMDIIDIISDGEYEMPVIIKAVVGGIKPFYAGLTHTNDLTKAIRKLVTFPVYAPKTSKEVLFAYKKASAANTPIMISERKELY